MRISETALSALNAISWSQAVTANNIANMNTEEFNPSSVTFEDRPDYGGVALQSVQEHDVQGAPVEVIRPEEGPDGTMVQTTQMVESSGTDVATEMVHMMMNETNYAANAVVVRTEDEMMGTLLDEMV